MVASYLGTAFCEGVLTGPTILLCDLNSDPNDEKVNKIYEKLVKYKIAFTNAEDASHHINNIWDSVDKWWNSIEVKNAAVPATKAIQPNDNTDINFPLEMSLFSSLSIDALGITCFSPIYIFLLYV